MAFEFGGGPEANIQGQADVSICLFPHLKEFLVIDIRKGLPGRPQVYLMNTTEVFTEAFYGEVEKGFSGLLRQKEQPFANLMGLPIQVEALVRERALEAMLKRINQDAPDAGVPQIAILVCTGPALSMNVTQLTRAVQRLFGREVDAWVIMDCVEMMEKLLAQEREIVKSTEQAQLRDMIRGGSQEYFTLWENPS